MARKRLTDTGVAALKPRAKMYSFPDPQLPGMYVRVMPTGSRSYVAVARDPRGKQVWHTIGNAAHVGVDAAREAARAAIAAIKAGADRAGPQSFQKVAEQWLARAVDAKGLRTANRVRNDVERLVLSSWGGRDFTSIRRGDVALLLDDIERLAGPVSADKVLAHLSNLFGWYAARHDDYASPIVRGMRRSKPSERARERVLTDDEIRALWSVRGAFADFCRVLLLTGQRREKVAAMRRDDLDGAVWTIDTQDREKGNAGELVLTADAVEIIDRQPRLASNGFVFASRRGDGHMNGWSKSKKTLDDALGSTKPWRLHDLRRTARSLMSRAGVQPLVAELVLGHSQKGVAKIYDRHSYRDEKAFALRALAGQITNILRPVDKKVLRMGERKTATVV